MTKVYVVRVDDPADEEYVEQLLRSIKEPSVSVTFPPKKRVRKKKEPVITNIEDHR